MYDKNKPTRLNKDQMAKLANECIERDNFLCQVCAKQAIELHHILYGSNKEDVKENLISLCRGCHTLAHQTKNKNLIGYLKDYHLKYIHETEENNFIRQAQ